MEKIGKVPLCNEMPDRAPHIGSFCFPLCWRCLSIAVGILTGTISIRLFHIVIINNFWMIVLGMLAMIPCLIDGTIQYCTQKYESTNLRRALFGFVAGLGIGSIISVVVRVLEMAL